MKSEWDNLHLVLIRKIEGENKQVQLNLPERILVTQPSVIRHPPSIEGNEKLIIYQMSDWKNSLMMWDVFLLQGVEEEASTLPLSSHMLRESHCFCS